METFIKETILKSIIDWLAGIEKAAWEAHERAAVIFGDDPEFSRLLKELAEDEKIHYSVLKRSSPLILDEDVQSIVSMDELSREQIMKPLRRCGEKIASGEVSKKDLVESIVEIEFSELNHVFLYFINTLVKAEDEDFSSAVENIEDHKGRIEEYVKSRPELSGCLGMIRRLPTVGGEKILIVDDSQVNLDLLRGVLAGEGEIVEAGNGAEALERLKEGRYAAVVTDVYMPRMNGVELYINAVERYPDLKGRFIFFTSTHNPEHLDFIRSRRLNYLKKPSPINAIRRMVREITSGENEES